MHETLRGAGAVVMSAPEAAKRVQQAFPDLRNVTSVPFGYDAAAFAGEPPARTDDRFRIVHVGEFHTEIGRRQERHRRLRRALGGDSTANILTRSPLHLMRALERLDTDRIELHLAGRLSAADEEILAGSPLVHRHGYLPHAQAVALMRSADLLFLPMQDVPGRAGLVPGKTYEYLAAGRPILAAVPDRRRTRPAPGGRRAHRRARRRGGHGGRHPRRAGAPDHAAPSLARALRVRRRHAPPGRAPRWRPGTLR